MNNFISGLQSAAQQYEQSGEVPHQVAEPGKAAGDYTPTGSIPQEAWNAAHAAEGRAGHANHDSVDWSNLSNLAEKFSSAEQKHGNGSGGLDFSQFAGFLGGGEGGSSNPVEAAKQQGANPNVVNKLMGFYHQKTGKTFNQGDGNPDGSFDELEQLAAQHLGINVPAPILKKMIMWKLKGMF